MASKPLCILVGQLSCNASKSVAIPDAEGDNARTAPALRPLDGFLPSPRSQPPGPFGLLVHAFLMLDSVRPPLMRSIAHMAGDSNEKRTVG